MSTARRRLIREAERVNPVAPVHIWRSPAGASVDMLIVAHLSAYSTIHQHATEALPNETGGFLIGRVAYDTRGACWHLEIEQAVPVEPFTQNPTHFTFTWRDVDRIRSYREEHGKALLGWYHTHPDLPVFLSETDLERTHRVLFSEPFQIALVYDPVRACAGYFFWEGPQRIDATQAPWREFEIAVRDDEADEETPPNGLPALAPVAAVAPPVEAAPAAADTPPAPPVAVAAATDTPAATPDAPPAVEEAVRAEPEAPGAEAESSNKPDTQPIVLPKPAPPVPIEELKALAADNPPPPPPPPATPPPPPGMSVGGQPAYDPGIDLPRSSESTYHRLQRLTLPKDAAVEAPIAAQTRTRMAAGIQGQPVSEGGSGRLKRIDPEETAAPPASRPSRTQALTLLVVTVLTLAALVTFAYFWLAPRQG
jgi:proteasome lid subunit RPN8/RPN11